MTIPDVALLAGLILICSLGPGLFVVRRLRWSPGETLCASVAASMVLVYLGSWAIYCFDWPPKIAHWELSVVCLLLTVACRRDLVRLLRNGRVRRMLAATGAIILWMLLLQLLIRHYAGGTWSGDWLEHYQRSLFFLEHGDLDFRFLNLYLLTDRPPIMNLLCAHYMAQVGPGFETYQLSATFLNLLPVLPCLLFATSISRDRAARRKACMVLPVLLALSPMFVQNVTYVWTKSFAAFFAILFLLLYVRGWQRKDRTRLVAAFICAAAGCLVHFSVVPLTLVVAAHYLLVVWPQRPRRWTELGAIAALPGMLLLSWFAWAARHYGVVTTFASNLTISDHTSQSAVAHFSKIGKNLFATIVPYFLRSAPYDDFRQNEALGMVRDLAFCLYQTNLIFILGSCGMLVLIYSVVRGIVPWRRWPQSMRRFWVIVLPLSIVLGIAAAPVAEAWGVAHLAMQTQALLVIAAIAGIYAVLPKLWQGILLAGCALDFVLGILLHLHLEHRVFEIIEQPGGVMAVVPTPHSLSHSAEFNLILKQTQGLRFIGDSLPGGVWMIEALLVTAVFVALFLLYKTGQTADPPS